MIWRMKSGDFNGRISFFGQITKTHNRSQKHARGKPGNYGDPGIGTKAIKSMEVLANKIVQDT